MATETVLSVLLSDLPPVSEQPTLLRALGLTRPVNPDYAATVEAHFIETDVDIWFASLGSRP